MNRHLGLELSSTLITDAQKTSESIQLNVNEIMKTSILWDECYLSSMYSPDETFVTHHVSLGGRQFDFL